jgi:hypothetical protein
MRVVVSEQPEAAEAEQPGLRRDPRLDRREIAFEPRAVDGVRRR